MQKIDFITLVSRVVMSFFTGTLYQTFRERRKANKEYGLSLKLFLIGVYSGLLFCFT
ncbi:hypothetical protein [Shimazuella alba]|uniref:Uncharacterized protein n=1 Tax=Shimazuella alba TaxID=2690964 RepID=A0A6I4VVE3_9BACL|nr:hypothetical protein [Shimazuella alba]MXQ54531.1 hypothetical protein [Shimazuella alba]